MKSFFTLLISLIITTAIYSQSGGNAFHPMTADGALSVTTQGHILYWENPDSVFFNDIYFSDDSSLVANLDPSVLILSGEPTSTVYDSVQITTALSLNTKYYWCVSEWYLLGDNPVRGFNVPVWYFFTIPPIEYFQNFFDSSLEGWQAAGPQGTANWSWSNTANAGAYPGEMAFAGNPSFTGTSYIMSPIVTEPAGMEFGIEFRYYLDFNSDTASVGFGFTTDNGSTWESLWQLDATGNVGPLIEYAWFSAPGNVRLGFYYIGNSNNINHFYVDDIFGLVPLTIVNYPPDQLTARASYTEKQVVLNWGPGSSIYPITGYRLQRQDGLPEDNNPYVTIGETVNPIHVFVDTTVNLNSNYTYRVATLSGPPSYYSNEATAYVPEVVPVELVSFSANAHGNMVTLNWMTATETNNRGFEVERQSAESMSSRPTTPAQGGEGEILPDSWETAGFVRGAGTTTEPRSYSFRDDLRSLSRITFGIGMTQTGSGKYSYRLKQIDFDGSYHYSHIVEVNFNTPVKYSLEQNYPNPFNPATTISYSISEDGFVKLSVYNVLGQKTADLVNQMVKAGSYQVNFNAAGLSSGVYYYRIETNGFTETRKMLLLR